jgi:hypothetical protein
MLPSLVRIGSGMFECRYIGAPPSSVSSPKYRYLAVAMDEICWENRHLYNATCVALPMLVMYAIIVPVLIMLRLRRASDARLNSPSLMMRWGFLHSGYRNSMYWWELVVLLRKYFIITASTFVVSDTNQLQMTFGIVLVALLLHITNHPFERDTQEGVTLHLYEMMSLLVLSVVIWCGQYFTNSPGLCETTMKGTCFFMVISIILINFVYMLFLLIKCGSHWWKRRRISKKLGRLKKLYIQNFPSLHVLRPPPRLSRALV